MAGVGKAKVSEVIALRIAGHTGSEIADALGVTRQSVSDTLNDPDVAREIETAQAHAREDLAQKVASAALESFDRLVWLSRGAPVNEQGEPDPKGQPMRTVDGKLYVTASVRRQALSDLLDRCGVTKETALRVESSQPAPVLFDLSHLTNEQLRALADDDLDRLEEELAEDPEP